MLKEIYIRDENDPYYDPRIIDFSNDMEYVLTQIRVILGTEKGDVLGAPNFGVNLEDYIFRTKYNSIKICDMLNEQISNHVDARGLGITTDLKFGDSGKGYDYALLDIYINGQKALGFLVDKEDDVE